MKAISMLACAASVALGGCGVETAATAASAAAIKQQEVAQGQKTLQRAEQKIDAAMQQLQTRGNSAE